MHGRIYLFIDVVYAGRGNRIQLKDGSRTLGIEPSTTQIKFVCVLFIQTDDTMRTEVLQEAEVITRLTKTTELFCHFCFGAYYELTIHSMLRLNESTVRGWMNADQASQDTT